MSGKWEGSNRRDGLPSWWPVTVRRIIKRDPICRCSGCRKCDPCFGDPQAGSCCRPSQEVDHITGRDNHKDDNLRGICRACHAQKSSREGAAAKKALKQPTKFFAEKPPGDLW